jgi:hypothetical protein
MKKISNRSLSILAAIASIGICAYSATESSTPNPYTFNSPALSEDALAIQQIALSKSIEIPSSPSDAIPDAQINSMWSFISSNWENTALPLTIKELPIEPSSLLKQRLAGLVQDLSSKSAIRAFTPEFKKQLDASGLGCKLAGHCTSINGLYLPMSSLIFLDTSLSDGEKTTAFLHELVHAYQFTYRFPLDLSLLYSTADHTGLKPLEIDLYLDYYYESQANWKALQFNFPSPWFFAVHGNQALQVGLSRMLVSGGAAAGAAFAGMSGGVGLLVYGASWLSEVIYGNITANRLLPNVAKSPTWFTIGNTPHDKLTAATRIPELVPIDDKFTLFSGFAAYNFQFHRDYGAAIQKYYFGPEGILFKNNRDDLEIYNSLHNQYYSLLGLSETVDNDTGCQLLLNDVRSSPVSPMLAWLTLPIQEIEACPVYKNMKWDQIRAAYLQDLLNPASSTDSFHSGLPGTEGSRTDLTLLPQLNILPLDGN